MLITTLRSALLAPSYRVIRGWLALVIALGGLSMPCWGQCPSGDVILVSQADVNQFPPGCSNLPGGLLIRGDDIVDLSPLSNLQTIGGFLEIGYNGNLGSLTGLDNLTAVVGYLSIYFNNHLNSISALSQLTSISGDLNIVYNPLLVSLTGLDNLTAISGVLKINLNDKLTDISALSNLTGIGGELQIVYNPQLSQCAIQPICQYLASHPGSVFVSNNAAGCNSPQQIEGQCNPIPIQITHQPPASAGRCAGDTVSLSVIATGTDPHYQWYKDGAAITDVSSATTATLLLTDLQPASSGHYTVQVTNLVSAQTSDPFSLTVHPRPAVTLTSNGPLSASQSTVTLTATEIAGASYSFSSGTTPGSTPNTATVTAPGLYSVTVTTSGGCQASDQTTVEAQAGSTTSFELINANTDQVIKTLSEGEVINLAQLPTSRLTIRANTTPANVGSVVFSLSGSMTYSKIETSAPYSLFGDDNGNYDPWNLKIGSYSLRATPYLGAGGSGLMGTPMTLNFTLVNQTNQPPVARAGADQTITLPTNSVTLNGSTSSDPEGGALTYLWTQRSGPNTANLSSPTSVSLTASNLAAGTYVFRLTVRDQPGATAYDDVTVRVAPGPSAGPSVVSFSLMNADTDQPIRTLINNEVINLATLPRNLNIRANTSPATVGSVRMVLSGQQKHTQTETGAPYALWGDKDGDYNNWTPALGTYTLTGTAYTGASASGQAGTPLTISFRVVRQASLARVSVPANAEEVLVYPNPFTDSFRIRNAGQQPVVLYDLSGRTVFESDAVQDEQLIEPSSRLAPGLYLLQVGQGKATQHFKVIKTQ
ncbi:putative secreted protein (Por secretion system target) [Larkinella arboricola]|uniref:Putative secreted protein (Por secretion system target) n=1 Tax=Larkinella arboricola TaxID=643671 RepID=A0A327WVR3_LARAB|nr:T9SS type A sorting domain-containing protein [Larkinella arboricola]RAJ97401.1 putative secreted protein (Por secretion system target) [Larkinella arboricola]